ncbi:MAG TPA: hypothetical protein VF747_14240, partial [Blastocatellia bacterium]
VAPGGKGSGAAYLVNLNYNSSSAGTIIEGNVDGGARTATIIRHANTGLITARDHLTIVGDGALTANALGSSNRVSIAALGVGIAAPANNMLQFAQATGDKILLYPGGNVTDSYGFGIQSNEMRFFTGASNNKMTFGYGSDSAFTPLFRMDWSAFSLVPENTNQLYLGSASKRFKSLFLSGDLDLIGLIKKNNVSLNLDTSSATAFSSADFTFANGSVFRSGEISLDGLNDVFFQGISASGALGYTHFEAYNSAGLILGTGGNASPVIFKINRVEAGRMTSSEFSFAGLIHSTSGGIQFPDGTTQTTAATGGGGGGISGLTTGRIPKASSATTIVDSLLSESGGNVLLASGELRLPAGHPNGLSYDANTLVYGGSSQVTYYLGGNNVARVNTTGMQVGSSGLFGFTASDAAQTIDMALGRNGAGVLEVNNGTGGQYRDLRLRAAFLSNNSFLQARNNADSAFVNLLKLNASDQIDLGGAKFILDPTNNYITLALQMVFKRNAQSAGASTSVDFSTGNVQEMTLTAATVTLTFSNIKDGALYYFIVKQDATGGRAISWPASVKWPGDIPPVLSTAASAINIITFVSDGTNLYGSLSSSTANSYTIGGGGSGQPAAGENVLVLPAAEAFFFPASFTGSVGYSVTAATGSTVFTFKRRASGTTTDTSFATMTWSAGARVPAFAVTDSTQLNFATGDILIV